MQRQTFLKWSQAYHDENTKRVFISSSLDETNDDVLKQL